jgi:hypothetical protein
VSGIWIAGAGAVGPDGLGLEAKRLRAAAVRKVPEGLPLKEGFPLAATRWLDPASLWWLNAVRQALAGRPEMDAGQAQVVGLGWGPTYPLTELLQKVRDEGFSAMNPALFPFSVGNAPAGQAGILLGLRGPTLTLHAKEAAGLAAVVEGCRLLGGGLADRCVAGGVDHLEPFLHRVIGPLRGKGALPPGEGAYAVALERREGVPQDGGVRVAAWCSHSAAALPHRWPEPEALFDTLLGSLCARSGWETESVGLAALSSENAWLRKAHASLLRRRMPRAETLPFQERLGCCGAAWAGATALACKALQERRASRAVLLALATGGAGWGLALEACGAQ